MFQFEFDLTRKDYIKYNIYHQSKSPYFKKTNLMSRLGIPIFFAIILLFSILAGLGYKSLIIMALVFIFISLLYNVFFMQIYASTLTRKIKEMERDGNMPFHKHSKLVFGQDYFTEIIPEEENKVDYDRIKEVVEIDGLLLLYLDELTATIIPLSVFESQEQKESFISFIEEKAQLR